MPTLPEHQSCSASQASYSACGMTINVLRIWCQWDNARGFVDAGVTQLIVAGGESSGKVLADLFVANAGRRVITACFASHVHRVQQVLDAAEQHQVVREAGSQCGEEESEGFALVVGMTLVECGGERVDAADLIEVGGEGVASERLLRVAEGGVALPAAI